MLRFYSFDASMTILAPMIIQLCKFYSAKDDIDGNENNKKRTAFHY